MPIQHVFTQTLADGTNTNLVRPSDWNSSHLQNWTLSGNTAGTANVSGTDIIFQGGNNLTLSGTGQTIVFSGGTAVSNTMGVSNLGNLVGTTGVVSGPQLQLVVVGGSNITLSQSLDAGSVSATITINAGLANVSTFSMIEPNPLAAFATGQFASYSQLSIYMNPMFLSQPITISRLGLLASMSAASGATASEQVGATLNVALYARNTANTIQLTSFFATDITGQISFNSNTSFGASWNGVTTSDTTAIGESSLYSGIKLLTIPFVTALSAGEYWLAFMNSTSSVGSSVALRYSMFNLSGSITGIGYPGSVSISQLCPMNAIGYYSKTSGAFPGSISLSEIGFSNLFLYFNFANYGT